MKDTKHFVTLFLIPCMLMVSACSDQVAVQVQVEATSSLLPADTIERLAERSSPRLPEGATAPSFVVDPNWPKHLPTTGGSARWADSLWIRTTTSGSCTGLDR